MTGRVYQDLQDLIQRLGSVTIRAKMNRDLCRTEFIIDFTDPDVAPDKSHVAVDGTVLETAILKALAYEVKRKNGQATTPRKKPPKDPGAGSLARTKGK